MLINHNLAIGYTHVQHYVYCSNCNKGVLLGPISYRAYLFSIGGDIFFPTPRKYVIPLPLPPPPPPTLRTATLVCVSYIVA